MGWIGMMKQLESYLSVVDADRDEEGKFLIGGKAPIVGMGGLEVVIHDETVYYVDGKPKALAAGLTSTSYGVAVRVF